MQRNGVARSGSAMEELRRALLSAVTEWSGQERLRGATDKYCNAILSQG